MAEPAPKPMTVDEFLSWQTERPEGVRHELFAGVPVAMAPERAGHTRVKYAVHAALAAAVRQARVPCEALGDGLLLRVDETTAYEPDAMVRCGPLLPDDAIDVPDPVIVVEVLSPGSRQIDTGAKLADYFRLASVVHYLIVATDRPMVIHHARHADNAGTIDTRIVTGGGMRLDPPGLTVMLGSFYPR